MTPNPIAFAVLQNQAQQADRLRRKLNMPAMPVSYESRSLLSGSRRTVAADGSVAYVQYLANTKPNAIVFKVGSYATQRSQ